MTDSRLDERTENAIEEYRGRSVRYYACECSGECVHREDQPRALDVLRSRIRELVEEARSNGWGDGLDDPDPPDEGDVLAERSGRE